MKYSLLRFLDMNDVEYKENVLAKDFSSIKIGGSIPIVIYPNEIVKLVTALDFLSDCKINYKVIGKATNVLFPDESFSGVIIKTDKLLGYGLTGDKLCLYSGERLSAYIKALARSGLGGLEELCGIPGSVGGMIAQNAGAFGKEISEVLASVTAYSKEERKVIAFSRDDMNFGYRTSIFKSDQYVILFADFHLLSTDPGDLLKRIDEITKIRAQTQPKGTLSLGSVFKRPMRDYAARLIDSCGLKGFSIGGAQVSERHAGFIVNKGNATASDFKLLADHIKREVKNRFDVTLEEEIEYL